MLDPILELNNRKLFLDALKPNNSNIIQEQAAIQGMMSGISKVTSLIRKTYGGNGSNIIIESTLRPGHMIANDAQTIVQAMKFTDHSEKRGLAFIQELCNKTDKDSGDGRKTTIILAEEILKAGYESDMPKLELKRALDELIPVIEAEIAKQTKLITVNDIEPVASIAGENKETGRLLQEIYQKIGKDGIIHLENSGTYETSYKFIEGVRFDMTGFLSPAMNHNDKVKAIYENPLILVTKKKITTDEDINPLLWEMKDQGKKDLIIFTNDMDSGVASMLVNLHKSGSFNICIIKAPTLWQDHIFNDFAKCTGATIVEDATGLNLRKLPFDALGTCDKITIDAEETIIIGHKDISEHIEQLKDKGDDDSKLRLSWLTNKTAILRLGANSETDLSYKRLKFADAIRSSELALKWGVVKGGGATLSKVATYMPDTVAGNIVKRSLIAPALQIMVNKDNSGVTGATTLNNIANALSYTDDDSIVDASKVVSTAVRNAIGIASTILTAGGYIYIPKPTPQEVQIELLNKQHHAF